MKSLMKSKEMTIKVGVQGREASEPKANGGGTVVEIATIHEFGLGNNPRRSFIADGYDESIDEAKRRLKKAGIRIADGANPIVEAERFGLWAAGEYQERMARGIPPALKPATIARKGSDKPLIDTGQLRSSITHKVET
jgi:phage gpG-like protein